jgi:hypothetical protein
MPEAPVVTTTVSSSAQETPKAAAAEPKTPTPATTQAAPAPASTKQAPEPAKVEAKEPAKPAAEPVKEGVKAEEKPAAGEAEKTKEAPKETPKEVVYDIPLLDGAAITKEEIEVVKAFSKEQGYSNDQAFGIAAYLDQVKVQNKAITDGKWLKECQEHPQYGKEKYGATSENIKRYLERVKPELIPLLESSRYGNNPVVFEYFAEQAARGADDTLVSGKQAVTQDNRTTMQKIADEFNKPLKK